MMKLYYHYDIELEQIGKGQIAPVLVEEKGTVYRCWLTHFPDDGKRIFPPSERVQVEKCSDAEIARILSEKSQGEGFSPKYAWTVFDLNSPGTGGILQGEILWAKNRRGIDEVTVRAQQGYQRLRFDRKTGELLESVRLDDLRQTAPVVENGEVFTTDFLCRWRGELFRVDISRFPEGAIQPYSHLFMNWRELGAARRLEELGLQEHFGPNCQIWVTWMQKMLDEGDAGVSDAQICEMRSDMHELMHALGYSPVSIHRNVVFGREDGFVRVDFDKNSASLLWTENREEADANRWRFLKEYAYDRVENPPEAIRETVFRRVADWRKDWRLGRDQLSYLSGCTLRWEEYARGGHEHCDLCWCTANKGDTGWRVLENDYWVCGRCCRDFQEQLGWKLEKGDES